MGRFAHFASLFGMMWAVTIVIYGVSTGNFFLGAKLGIVTSLSKATIAKAHAWGWDRWFIRRKAA